MAETATKADPTIRVPDAILESGDKAWAERYVKAVRKQRVDKAAKKRSK